MLRFNELVPEELHKRFTKELADWNIENENKRGWVCKYCGKSTYENDYDDLISPIIHIHCLALEENKLDK